MEEKSTAQLTEEYIKSHPYIQSCLKKGIINYSSLARLISKEIKINSKSSKEAILIAARRYAYVLKKQSDNEKKIKDFLADSSFILKNKVTVFIIKKQLSPGQLDSIAKKIREQFGVFFLIEGSNSYTLIIEEKYVSEIKGKIGMLIIQETKDLVLLTFTTSKEIEYLTGVVAYLSSLLAENGINIREHISCWTDTLFVIEKEDMQKAINLFSF